MVFFEKGKPIAFLSYLSFLHTTLDKLFYQNLSLIYKILVTNEYGHSRSILNVVGVMIGVVASKF